MDGFGGIPLLAGGEEREDRKMEEDFSALVDARLPELLALAQKGDLAQANEGLRALEKRTRQGGDGPSTRRVATAIVDLILGQKDWAGLKETLQELAKRRGQFRQVIQAIVKQAMGALDSMEMSTKLDMISTLISITEGKIFVEIERATLTRILAKIKEDEGKIAEAADLLQEVQVETFGAMDPRAKIDYILEQMRLCLANKDYIRTQILSRKITNKALVKEEYEDLKLRYHELLVQYYTNSSEYLNICRSYRAIYETKLVQKDKAKWQQVLKLIVFNVVLAPFDNEQSELMHLINADKKLSELPKYKTLLKYFITIELVRWPRLLELYRAELEQLPSFQAGPSSEQATKLWKDLHARVVEHNIRVVAQYYDRITMTRFAELLDLDEKETEKFISDMVSTGVVWARIDRPSGRVTFTKRKEPSEVLNDWSHNISDLLNLLEKSCHLIHRENMVHGL